jgi:hypothetical protein
MSIQLAATRSALHTVCMAAMPDLTEKEIVKYCDDLVNLYKEKLQRKRGGANETDDRL